MKLAVALLLSLIAKNDIVRAIHSRTNNDLTSKLNNDQQVDAYAEIGRFINAKGQAINLAQESGHARLVLTKTRKYDRP